VPGERECPPVQTTRRGSALLKVASIRALEERWFASLPAGELMQRAAIAVADEAERMLRELPRATTVLALIGPGNNGADALLAALDLTERGFICFALALSTERPKSGDAAAAWNRWTESGREIGQINSLNALLAESPLVIDGLFGIGLKRPITGAAAEAVAQVNRLALAVVAVDVPSGIDADRGSIIGGPEGIAVRASSTVTMIADKPGLHTGEALDHVGRLHVVELHQDSLPMGSDADLLEEAETHALIAPRGRNTNKGSFGTVGIIGGAQGMGGAALLAARGAQAAGAGKVFIASPDAAVFDPAQAHLMTRTMSAAFSGTDALCMGCGLGSSGQAADALQSGLRTSLPLVLDADALNLLCALPKLVKILQTRQAPTILTPHPLEAARLLGWTVDQVQAQRQQCAVELAATYRCCVVLKGAGSIIAIENGEATICASGAPALATAGTGDVLAGVITTLLAQAYPPRQAAMLGTSLHALAGERWQRANPNGIGMSAAELPALIRQGFNRKNRID
jgi:hydroxyethylthiazole kinase-like uncharacterized protein yjeF